MWRTSFPELREMLPARTDPQEIVRVVKSLLPRINMQGDFTYATHVALCKYICHTCGSLQRIKLHLPNVADTATTRDGQDARVAN